MANCYIDFDCTAQSLQRVLNEDERLNVVAANAANVILARFTLCPKWDGLAVYARFEYSHAVYDIPLADGCAAIPWEVLKWPGFHVSLFGEDGEGGRLTSVRAFVDVARSIDWEGVPPIPSTPSLIQTFIDKAAASAAIAEELKAAAEAGEFDGEKGEKGDPGEPGNFNNVTGVAPIACQDETIWFDSTGAAADYALVADGEGGVKWEKQKLDYPLTIEQGGTGATDAATARANLEITPANIGAAAASHEHAAGDITSGTLPIERGGTGAGTAAEALGKIGAAAAVHSHGAADIEDLQELRKEMGLGDTLGVLPVANGGTGADSVLRMLYDAGQPLYGTIDYDADTLRVSFNVPDGFSVSDFRYMKIMVDQNTLIHSSSYQETAVVGDSGWINLECLAEMAGLMGKSMSSSYYFNLCGVTMRGTYYVTALEIESARVSFYGGSISLSESASILNPLSIILQGLNNAVYGSTLDRIKGRVVTCMFMK